MVVRSWSRKAPLAGSAHLTLQRTVFWSISACGVRWLRTSCRTAFVWMAKVRSGLPRRRAKRSCACEKVARLSRALRSTRRGLRDCLAAKPGGRFSCWRPNGATPSGAATITPRASLPRESKFQVRGYLDSRLGNDKLDRRQALLERNLGIALSRYGRIRNLWGAAGGPRCASHRASIEQRGNWLGKHGGISDDRNRDWDRGCDAQAAPAEDAGIDRSGHYRPRRPRDTP